MRARHIHNGKFIIATSLILGSCFSDAQRPPRPASGQIQRGGSPGGSARSTLPTGKVTVKTIQYFSTLERGLAEAKRSNRPILFVTGAPHCAGVSGMWCPGKGKIDEGYLTKPEIISAAERFVCIRLTSYENAQEQAFVEKITGVMLNTAFAVLNPDGTPALQVRGNGRGPGDLFSSVGDMVNQMNVLANKFPATDAQGLPALPITLSPKVGMAVAAADLQPLVVIVSSSAASRADIEAKVARRSWSNDFKGQLCYASASSISEIPQLRGETLSEGILLIEPNFFGSGGDVVKKVATSVIDTSLDQALRDVLANHVRVAKSRQELHRKGVEAGVYYETGIPVSGKRESQDREKYKQQLDAKRKGG
ncbi:MAG: hypothetical protein QE269_06855 [Fimbriimonas sp.]|nr:hypothetical protein [Fimbriimonas sp.]